MESDMPDTPMVRHFRQRLIWPLQLVRGAGTHADEPLWCLLERDPGAGAWQRVTAEIGADSGDLQERHYKEFVVFLPHVRRFLYGEGRGRTTHPAYDPPGEAARRIYRRTDVAAVRVALRAGQSPLTLRVVEIALAFFDDVDVAILSVELATDNISLPMARDFLYHHGRAYPTGWTEQGECQHNAVRVEWLGGAGQVLATSDVAERHRYLAFARAHRALATATHWAFLLRPLVLDAGDEAGALRYRQIEYHRMPQMAYLAVDDPRRIGRDDWIRLGLVATLHPDEPVPATDPDVMDFESRYCYDRFWTGTDTGPNTRFLCSGRAFLVVGEAGAPYFVDDARGILAQFRHQYALLFLINHLHRAALLVFADQLADTIHDLDRGRPDSVRRFQRRVRAGLESFLRFTHRYWFHELSERPHMRALHRLCAGHLHLDVLFAEVREGLHDMVQYLDSEATRRANTIFVRLTVITVFSIVGTVATGILGMNIFALADAPASARLGYFVGALASVAAILLFAVIKSRHLSDMMDLLSNDRLPLGERFRELVRRHRADEGDG